MVGVDLRWVGHCWCFGAWVLWVDVEGLAGKGEEWGPQGICYGNYLSFFGVEMSIWVLCSNWVPVKSTLADWFLKLPTDGNV